MNREKLQFFRANLEKMITELSNDQAKTMAELLDSGEAPSDIIDQAFLQVERNFELRIRDRERRLIGKMMEAIERIDDGTYGICDDCGEDIAEKRLIARPVTTLCIKCKTKQEKAEHLKGRWGNQAPPFFF